MPTDDIDLLARWRGGDNIAASALLKRHVSMLKRLFATKARGYEEDLIQSTFVACVESRDAFRGDSSFQTYLYRLARTQLFAHYRKEYRTRAPDFTVTSACALGTSPSAALLRREERDLVARALRQVPIDQQIALKLSYGEGLSAPEIAGVLSVAENTVYSRLHRAKANLREALARMSDTGS